MTPAAHRQRSVVHWRRIFALALFAGLMLLALALANSGRAAIETPPPPSVWSDKADYAPGETVTLSGANWAPGESVHIRVNDDAGQTWSRDVDVTAAADGTISDQFNLPNWFVAVYNVTATGASSGSATWSFTDAIQTTTTLTSSLNPSNLGQAVTFTATITCNSACTFSSQTVDFVEGANQNCNSGTTLGSTSTLTGSGSTTRQATFTTSALSAGTHPIRACFNGGGPGTTPGSSTSDPALSQVVNADGTPPTVVSINRVGASPTNTSGNVSWTVTFSESVTGVDSADFALANVGLGGPPAISTVTGSAASYTVTASSGTGSGTLGLNLNDNDSIQDGAGNKLGGTGTGTAGGGGTGNGSFVGQVYTIDRAAPTVTAAAVKGDAPSFSGASAYAANTWTNKDVRVTFTCADTGGSGLTAGSGNQTQDFTSETSGATASFSGTCADNAGNSAGASTFGPIKIDKTAPNTTIDTNPSDPSNSSSASFTFSGSDAGSGVASFECQLDGGGFAACTSPQSYTGLSDGSHTFQVRAIDAAGNVDASPASFTWVIDTEAPTLTAAAVKGTAPLFTGATPYIEDSWTNEDVRVDFTCVDNTGGSGVASGDPDPASVTFDTEGLHTASSDCSDNAGNSTSKSFGVKIDKTPPTITFAVTPAPNAAGWNNSDVTVSYTCADALSGVTGCPSDVPVSDEGLTTIHRGISDNAGNVAESDATVLIDKGKPSSSATSPAYNNDGVIDVSYSALDTRSGVKRVDLYAKAPGESAYALVMSDVAGVGSGIDHAFAYVVPTVGGPTDYVQGTYRFYTRATDVADNVEDAPAMPDSTSAQTLEDSIAPDTAITSHPSDPSNSSSASFVFTYTDGSPSSGLKRFECKLDAGSFTTCSSPQSYSSLGEGSHTFQVRAVDNADNTDGTPASFTWVVDTISPSLAVSHTADGANGWNVSDPVAVTVSASDGGSGLDGAPSCTVDGSPAILAGGPGTWTLSVTGEGTHPVNCSVSDLAGNGQTAGDTVKIDTVKPVISGSQSPNANSDGWNNSNVTVSFTCADGGANASGIDVNSVAGATLTHEGRNQSVTNTGVCKDKAGNVADSSTVSGIKIDKTGPNAPSGHTNHGPEYTSGGTDWFKDDVTVSFTSNGDPDLEDLTAGSGVASVTAPEMFSSAGSFTKTGKATDRAGNDSSGTTVSGNIDTQKPVVTLTCPASVILGSTASGSWTASDPGTASQASGIPSGFGSGSIALDTSTVGTHTGTVPANTSKDNVGHFSAAATCSYTVAFNFTGFFAPVDMNNVCNAVKAGSAVPIKFSLHGNQGMNIFAAGYPKVSAGTCSGVPLDTVEETVTAGNSSLNYDSSSDQYIYVWKTDKAWAGKAMRFTIVFADGTSQYARFTFTK